MVFDAPKPCFEGALSRLDSPRLESPKFRAPFPAALSHGASGPERRRAFLGRMHAPAPLGNGQCPNAHWCCYNLLCAWIRAPCAPGRNVIVALQPNPPEIGSNRPERKPYANRSALGRDAGSQTSGRQCSDRNDRNGPRRLENWPESLEWNFNQAHRSILRDSASRNLPKYLPVDLPLSEIRLN